MNYLTSLTLSLLVVISSITIKGVIAFTVHPTTTSLQTINSGIIFRRYRNIHDNTESSSSRLKRSLSIDHGWNKNNYIEALSFSNSGYNEVTEKANAGYYREFSQRVAIRNHRLKMSDGDGTPNAIFGGKVEGMPDEAPKHKPTKENEENPMGGQMFKRMMEQAKKREQNKDEGRSTRLENPSTPDTVQPPVATTIPNPVQQQQQQYGTQQPQSALPGVQQQQQPMNPQAYYQLQLQAWQQQVMAFTEFSAANPEAAASMTMPPPPPPPPPTYPMEMQYPEAAASMTMPPPPPPPAYPMETQQVGVNQIPQQSLPVAPVSPSDQSLPEEALSPRDYLPKPPKSGGNVDSYEISNTADVYLAQLKRDTLVRNKARFEGDADTANRPLEEEGVQAIKGVLSEELIDQRRKQRENESDAMNDYDENTKETMIEARDAMRREQEGENEEKVDVTNAGVSYRQKLEEAKKKRDLDIGTTSTIAPEQQQVAVQAPPSDTVVSEEISSMQTQLSTPDPTTTTTPVENEVDTLPVPQPDNAEIPSHTLPINVDETAVKPAPAPSSLDTEETRRMVRTLMGLILKHRGGPGFGSGRLKVNEQERMEGMFEDVLTMLKGEIGLDVDDATEAIGDKTETEDDVVPEQESSASLSAPSLNKGVLACVNGAIKVYENASTSTEREGLLMPLRDALLSAASEINRIIAECEVENSKKYNEVHAPKAEVDLSTDILEKDNSQPQYPTEVHESTENLQSVVKEDQEASDSSSEAILQEAYDALEAMKGDGKFGVKRDITPGEMTHVSDILMNMRDVLINELDPSITGKASGESEVKAPTFTSSADADATPSGSSKYQQMLAKAKAEEASRK